jgi:hypothetical protein
LTRWPRPILQETPKKRFAVVALLFVLSAQTVSAAPDNPRHSWGGRVRHVIVTILDQLGVPWP